MGRLRVLHRYVSLAFAALWLVQAASGALLVFRWELDDAAVRGPAGPVRAERLGARLEALQRAFPLAPVQLYADGGAAGRFDVLVGRAPGRIDDLRVDGAGEVLRWRPWNYDWSRVGVLTFAAWLHDTLFAGAVGEALVGMSGLVLLANLVLATRLAWPLGLRWRAALWPRPPPHPAARVHAWHRAAGLWVGAAAGLLALTGAALAFDAQLRALLQADHPAPTVRGDVAPVRSEPVGAATAMRIGLDRYPAASLYSLVLPAPAQPWYRVGLRQPGEAARFAGQTVVYVAAADGHVILDDDALKEPARVRALDALYALHTGEIAGLTGRSLAVLTGLSLATLVGLGLALWALRRRRRAAPRASLVAAPLSSSQKTQ